MSKLREAKGKTDDSQSSTGSINNGVGRFGANMLRWGLSKSDSCDCGAEQTADHITSGRCPIYRLPEGINGLIGLDNNTQAWLENNALDMSAV